MIELAMINFLKMRNEYDKKRPTLQLSNVGRWFQLWLKNLSFSGYA
ncbi:hypothetical protein HMPREF0454_02805 [Hafnia alvei ATCC 51873]|uniref:Uncharacterized protein n=1 Tax=Hafnia alvei ATCC 51873 TaxID=1002364 RepID=G9Y895_HAFAL|nr:hypothetical protein HMPREF0454_02805 [Hafnia alvei ATCC 51873]